MTVKLFSIIIFISLIPVSCNSQVSNNETSNEDWAMRIDSPTKDSLDKYCKNEIKDIIRIKKGDTNDCDLYYLNAELFTGWACEIISNNRHKYRYEQYEKGKMIRRIAYYDNGQIDADFRMRNCKNFGPSRMWLYNGKLYIDEFYITPGVKHGLQKQWHDNGILARESKFENGKLLYEKTYDRNGNAITSKN